MVYYINITCDTKIFDIQYVNSIKSNYSADYTKYTDIFTRLGKMEKMEKNSSSTLVLPHPLWK